MKHFTISENERNQIIREISEAPAKYSFNAITILGKLRVVTLQEKPEPASPEKCEKTDLT